MMNESKRLAAQWLGYAGLIPFAALAALLVFGTFPHKTDRFTIEIALLLYGAIILTFIGALPWAHAMHRAELGIGWMVWSVLPSLVAWGAMCATLLARDFATALSAGVLVAGFIAQLIAEFRLRDALPRESFPDWFLRMRIHLTIGACASLSVPLFIR
jgi:Protein of unknown function (DUF3429)